MISCGTNSTGDADTNLYFNNGSELIEQSTNFKDYRFCSVSVVDFNNDGQIDIILSGTQTNNNLGLNVTSLFQTLWMLVWM